jgi:NAD-dependent dihydropyrimidine dehydrogenase PreA subunit
MLYYFNEYYFYGSKRMAFKITDACVNCGACEGDCPVGAIVEQGDKRVIEADKCISCGSCAASCPTEAITEE